MSHVRGLHAVVLMIAIAVAALMTMDGVSAPDPVGKTTDVGLAAPDHPGHDRLFILLIDSLRLETAMDEVIMPRLAALRDRGTWAVTNTTRDALTTVALRAAFTGRDRFAVFGFAENLWHRNTVVESLFSQLEQEGRRVAIYSDGSFLQFGEGSLTDRFAHAEGPGDSVEREHRQVDEALRTFASGDYDLVVSHVIYTDHVAHRVGIHDPQYAEAFTTVDGLIAHVDATLDPDATLLIMGDHGHDALGRHMVGQTVPTQIVIRGPGFARDVELRQLAITDVRYLASWALELPLVEYYHAGLHPEGLVDEGRRPSAFATSFDLLADQRELGRGVWRTPLTFVLSMVAVALLIGAWLQIVVAVNAGPLLLIGTWLGVALLAVPAAPPLTAGLSAASVGVASMLRLRAEEGKLRIFLASVLAAMLLVVWGYTLSSGWSLVHRPRFLFWGAIVIAVIVVGVAVGWRLGSTRVTAALTLLWGGMGYPTVYRYGAPASMGPVWVVWVMATAAERWRRNGWRNSRRLLLRSLIVLLLISPFLLVYAYASEFHRWYGFMGKLLWAAESEGRWVLPGFLLAFAAKGILFLSGPGGRWARVGGAVGLILLTVMQLALLEQWLTLSWRWLGPTVAVLTAAAALWFHRRRHRSDSWRQLSFISGITAGGIACCAFIRPPDDAFLWLDCLLAALLLSARIVREADPGSSARRVGHLLLLVFAVWAAGWASLAWTLHRMEWGFLYDWLDAGLVEHESAFFIIPISFRYLILALMTRAAVTHGVGPETRFPLRAIRVVVGLKVLSLLLVTCGIGAHHMSHHLYLEAVHETAIWALLGSVMFFAWPGYPGSRDSKTISRS